MTTLNEHIAKLQAIADSNRYAGEMQVGGCVSSSGAPYEIGSVLVTEADEDIAEMLGIREGNYFVQISLGN